jgi:colanic acid/amylovoran biosynthesis glycosyltransferase
MTFSKKITYLVSSYPAVNHTYILREVRELRRLGWDINVASIRPDTRPLSELTVEEQEERSRTWCVTTHGISGALQAHLVSLTTQTRAYFRGLRCALRLGGIDLGAVVRSLLYFTEALIVGQWMQRRGHTHMHVHFASTVAWLVVQSFPITFSITIHGPAEFEAPASLHLVDKIEAATFICAISHYGRSQLMRVCDPGQWRKLETIPLGIDPEKFVPSAKSSVERLTFDIVSVARLSPEKAQRILIDAVATLINDGRRVRLRLVGEGPDRAALERHIIACGLSGDVCLEGALNQDQLRAIYRESDAFALASFAEGLPVVLMEAMALEIPCVATWIAGIPELIQNGLDGLLVPPSDVLQLSMAIARLMDNSDLRERVAAAGRFKVIRHYNLAKNTALLADLFETKVLRSPISSAPKLRRG